MEDNGSAVLHFFEAKRDGDEDGKAVLTKQRVDDAEGAVLITLPQCGKNAYS